VETVSWDDLKDADGFLARTGLDLPSEAQWEYAARGGTSTAFSFGDECNVAICDPCVPADDFMWWCGNAGDTTHPVGGKLPNPFGLYDMHGNVNELCEDEYYAAFYGKPEATSHNPLYGTLGAIYRVHTTHGGSAAGRGEGTSRCRSASRREFQMRRLPDINSCGDCTGFRPVRPLH